MCMRRLTLSRPRRLSRLIWLARARAQVEVDLGKFEGAEEAARAHDRAAVWCLGLTAPTNFPIADSLRVRAPAQPLEGAALCLRVCTASCSVYVLSVCRSSPA